MKNYWRALACGVEAAHSRQLDQFLILEDDVELCANALPYIASSRVPAGMDFVTWFDGHALPASAAPGFHVAPIQRFICLQAVTWPVTTAMRLLESERATRWSEPHRGDLLVRHILTPGSYAVHVPNLVEHRGAHSLCSPGQTLQGNRVALNYPGPGFDALSLDRGA